MITIANLKLHSTVVVVREKKKKKKKKKKKTGRVEGKKKTKQEWLPWLVVLRMAKVCSFRTFYFQYIDLIVTNRV
jgi:hypothetical protein